MKVEWWGVGGQFQQKLSDLQITIDCGKEKFLPLDSWGPVEKNKTKILPKSTKTQKNTINVRMTSYSSHGMSKKLAPQKLRVSIFRTNEGDFSGTPQKTNNRRNSAMNF